MKNKIYAITLLILSSIIFSCESDDLDYQNDFEISKSEWLKFKKLSNNSYKYTAVAGSWVGISWETTITVSNGKIIGRHFKYIMTDGLSEDFPVEELEWTENENEIGIKNFGAEPLTLTIKYMRKLKMNGYKKMIIIKHILELKITD